MVERRSSDGKASGPDNVGKLTVAGLKASRTVDEHTRMVQAWANSAWQAYAKQHELARGWIKEALSV